LVSGGAQGIGLEFCRKILGGGGRVFIADINEERGAKTKHQLVTEFGKRVEFGKLDVRSQEEWKSVWTEAETFFGGQVEGFCNNAGIFHHTDWLKVRQVNLDGAMFGAMLAYERMGIRNGGRGGLMVMTASVASLVAGGYDTLEQSMYTVTKHGVLGLVRSLATQKIYEIEKVRTVGICPLFVDTDLVRSNMDVGRLAQFGTRLLKTSEVGDAFERLVVEGKTGDMLVCLPGMNYFYPNWNRDLLKIFYVLSKIAKKMFGLPAEAVVASSDIVKVAGILLFILFVIFHVFLRWLGY